MLNLLPALFLLLVNGPLGPEADGASIGRVGPQVHQRYEGARASVGLAVRALALVAALAERQPTRTGPEREVLAGPGRGPTAPPHSGFDRGAPVRAGPTV